MAPIEVAQRETTPTTHRETVFDIRGLSVYYGSTLAVSDVNLEIYRNMVTALIGPSGCGKSTFIRCLNRMNDLIPSARIDGEILYHGQNMYGSGVDPASVRRWIGMVFQKPNPFPKSIYDNVAWGPRTLGMRKGLDERVERALTQAALWDEVKDRLKRQRARALRRPAAAPLHRARARGRARGDPARRAGVGARPDRDVEHRGPDPRAQARYTIVIVTHNMQQAARVSDMTAFFSLDVPRTAAQRDPGRVRRDAEDLHAAVRRAHRGLRHRALRLMALESPSRRSSTEPRPRSRKRASSSSARCAAR